jgi:hypothetical protein
MRRSAVVAVLTGVVVLTSCAGGPPPDSGVPSATIAPAYRTAIDQVLAKPDTTDFERQILSDYQITDAEYQEARERYKQCLTDLGWVVEDSPDGGYQYSGAPGTPDEGQAVPHTVTESCSAHTIQNIEGLYRGMRQNPEGLSKAQQVRACFEAHSVPDGAGLSDDALIAWLYSADYRPSTPEGLLCRYDPTGSLGLTVEQAEGLYHQGHPGATLGFG